LREAAMDIDQTQLEELMQLLDRHGFDELEIERGEERVLLRRNAVPIASPAPAAIAGAPAPAPAEAAPGQPAPAQEEGPDVVFITSPFVGTFYRSPSPESDPFVEVGQQITAGQTLCIVEAMKLMNEIEAEIRGTILDILIDNGTPVEYGDRLFKVRKTG
jgi:acetyl-CoA carboxylase biotin carboxyl carrier protein